MVYSCRKGQATHMQGLTTDQLEALLAAGESDRIERKASAADREEIKKAICAFANDFADHAGPGVIFVGVRDDGAPAGLTIDDGVLQLLAGFRSEGNLLPLPSITVEKRRLRGADVAVVQVLPSDNPPVRLRGKAWIRVGPACQVATPEEERRLIERRRRAALPFDQSPVTGASINDLDLNLFRDLYLPGAVAPEVLRENERPVEQQLASLRLMLPDGRPTVAGLLVVGREVRRWLPGVYAQFVRFDGPALTDPILDQKVIEGPLPTVMRLLDDVLTVNIRVATQVEGTPVEVRRPDYPAEALRQLIRNAVMHRAYDGTNAPVRLYWFSDRVEVSSPGGPFGLVNRSNFGRPGVADYRNPQIAEAMRVLGYVQRFGLGIPLAQKALAQNGNPPAEFAVEPTHVVATVRPRP